MHPYWPRCDEILRYSSIAQALMITAVCIAAFMLTFRQIYHRD